MIAQMPRAGFCYHPKRMENVDKCAVVKKEMTAVYRENRGRHGDRRIAAGLRDRNFPLDHKAVRRLMKKLVCHVRMKKYRFYMGKVGKNTPNLLNRNFHVEKSN